MSFLSIGLTVLFFLQNTPAKPGTKLTEGPRRQKIEGIAAIVNNEVITETELKQKLEASRKSFGFEDPAEWARFTRETLVKMTKDKRLTQAARRAPLDQQEINARVEKILKEREKDAGGKSALIENLQNAGKTYDQYVKELYDEISARSLGWYELGWIPGASGRPAAEIYVSPSEVKQYYFSHAKEFTQQEAVHGRQIFISGNNDRDLKKLEEVQQKLSNGEDFEALAKQYSDWKPEESGDLGWVSRENSAFAKPIMNYLFSSTPGSISPPIRVYDVGITFIKVEEHREKRLKPFEEVQASILKKIEEQLQKERFEALDERLLRDFYIWPPELKNFR